VNDCAICGALETPVLHETAHWRTALNRNQNLLGKLIVVLRRHEEDVTALSADEWSDLRGEIRWATARLRRAFEPDHFNYSFLQNQDRHVHLHVIPRYATPRRIADLTFEDDSYPGHYVAGEERLVEPDVVAGIAQALSD
jgi:diadenosine tetraphosphate (Ap4A) HIT family hydrolase